MNKEISEIAKALEYIAKNLTAIFKKAGKPSKPEKVAKALTLPVPKTAKARPTKGKASKSDTSLGDLVVKSIRQSRKGINVEGIQTKTGLNPRQVSNILYKLIKEGAITRIDRGVYMAATVGTQPATTTPTVKKAAAPKAKAPKTPKGKTTPPKGKATPPTTKDATPSTAGAKKIKTPKAGKTVKAAKETRKPRRVKVIPQAVEQPTVDQESLPQEPQVQDMATVEVQAPDETTE